MSELRTATTPAKGVLAIDLVPKAALSGLQVTETKRDGLTLRVKIQGKAKGLPPGLPLVVSPTVSGAGAITPGAGVLRLDDVSSPSAWSPESEHPCTIEYELDILEARLFGNGSVSFTIAPNFPFTETAKVGGSAPFNHKVQLDVVHGDGTMRPDAYAKQIASTARIGTEIGFQSDFDASVFGSSPQLLLVLSEDDKTYSTGTGKKKKKESESYTTKDYATEVLFDGKQSQLAQLGCSQDGAGVVLQYPESDERGDNYEFAYTLMISCDAGKKYHRVRTFRNWITVPRPKLSTFKVTNDGSGLPVRIHAKLSNFAKGLAVQVDVALWGVRTLTLQGPKGKKQSRVATELVPFETVQINEDGSLNHIAAEWKGSMASDLAECEQFFAVMRFPDHATDAGSSEVFANVLAYDEGKFCPFGVGDFLRGKKKRWKASAPAICSSDLPQNDLPSVVPQFGAIDVAISGETLALTARLFGPPAYWKSAKPKFLVTGQDATGYPDKTYTHLVAKIPMSKVIGQTITIAAEVQNADAKLPGGAQPPDVGVVRTTYRCVMEFDRVDVEPTTLKEKPVFKVTAHGKFLPTSGKNFSFRIKDPADEVIKNVSITVERKGVAYPNGTVVGWIYSKSREALEKQSFCVEVYRYYQQGKVYGHEIAPVKSPIVSPPTQYSTPPSPL